MKSLDLVIFGVGGYGRELHQHVRDVQEADASIQMIGWLDDDPSFHGTSVHGRPVLGDGAWLRTHPHVSVVIGVGWSGPRSRVVQQLRAGGHTRFATLRHPTAVVGRDVTIGEGSVVCAGCVITTNISIGAFVAVGANSTIGHDSVLHDFVTLTPASTVGGSVTIGTGTNLGTGCTVIHGLSIGEHAMIGAGAVVISDVPDHSTVVGNPARLLNR